MSDVNLWVIEEWVDEDEMLVGAKREPSVADLVAALLNEGGEIAGWCQVHGASVVEDIGGCGFDRPNDCLPIRSLVVPLEDE